MKAVLAPPARRGLLSALPMEVTGSARRGDARTRSPVPLSSARSEASSSGGRRGGDARRGAWPREQAGKKPGMEAGPDTPGESGPHVKLLGPLLWLRRPVRLQGGSGSREAGGQGLCARGRRYSWSVGTGAGAAGDQCRAGWAEGGGSGRTKRRLSGVLRVRAGELLVAEEAALILDLRSRALRQTGSVRDAGGARS